MIINDFNEEINFDKLIDDYLMSLKSKDVIEYYLTKIDIKPKNIYTEVTDFRNRYRIELILLNKIFSMFTFPQDILIQIPEINEFYPFLIKSENKKNKVKNEIELLFEEIKSYFKHINAREYGEYYSSETLINTLIENLKNNISINTRVIDPSSGGGFILFYYVKSILKNNILNQDEIDTLKNNIFGYDIFPFSIIISKILMGKLFEKENLNINNAYTFKNIRINNTLKTLTCMSNDKEKFDLIIGNPPYFRIDPHDENNICKCVSFGHSYAHNLFIHWSIQHLNKNGELGLILPQSILSGYYYKKMRLEIIKELSIELIITSKEHEKHFSVQQDIMLFIASKKSQQSSHYNIGVSGLNGLIKYPMNSNIIKNKLNVIPLFKDQKEYENFKNLSKKSIVKDLSFLKIGTGNFVWNQNKDYCFSIPNKNTLPLINGSNITLDGISLESSRKNTFSYCIPNNPKYIKKDYCLLYRRMSPIGNKQRIVAFMIDPNDKRFSNGYVIENHVNFIDASPSILKKLLSFMISKEFNSLINSFCHTNQVSTNDLVTIFELLKGASNDKN